jgi:hypothetical protein
VGVLAGCCAKNNEDAINTNAQEIFIFGIMRLTGNLLFDFKHGADFTPIPPVRDIVKQFFIRSAPNGLRSAAAPPKLPDIPPL